MSRDYLEVPPAADLASFVACGWVRRVRNGARVAEPIVPDGCADILVCDDAPPFLVGPDTQTRWVALGDGLAITALRLRPGALRAVFGVRAAELLDAHADLAALAPGAQALHRALQDARSANARLALLAGWVRGRLAPSAHDRAAVAACRALAAGSGDLARIADGFGWSVRTLHRQFIATCGYGPKHMQKVLRVQRALRLAHDSSLRLGDLAAHVGFADQAHMARDFRAITGFTARDYLARAEPGVGRWLEETWDAPLSDSFKTRRGRFAQDDLSQRRSRAWRQQTESV